VGTGRFAGSVAMFMHRRFVYEGFNYTFRTGLLTCLPDLGIIFIVSCLETSVSKQFPCKTAFLQGGRKPYPEKMQDLFENLLGY
jgi:hypothetical protein